MRRACVLLAVCVATSAAPAEAETVLPTPHAGAATCLRAAGAGAVSLTGGEANGAIPAELAGGPFTTPSTLALGGLAGCPVAAVDPPGMSVVAASAIVGRAIGVAVATSDHAGRTALDRGLGEDERVVLAAAVNASGAAAVVWARTYETNPSGRRESRTRIGYFLARRPAGGTWGPATALGPARTGGLAAATAAVSVDAAGTTTVAWAPLRASTASFDGVQDVEVARAPAGGALGQATQLVAKASGLDPLALGVAGDDAVLAVGHDDSIDVFESTAGAGAWTQVARVDGRTGSGSATPRRPAVAVGPAGALLVAWRSDGGRIAAQTRAAAGPLGAERTLVPGRPGSDDADAGISSIELVGRSSGPVYPPIDEAPGRLSAAVGDDGSTLVAYADTAGVHALTGTLADPAAGSAKLGSPCLGAFGSAALAATPPQLAWSENHPGVLGLLVDTGTLHLTSDPVADARAARARVPPASAVSAPPGIPAVHYGDPLHVTVRCDGPCDVSATQLGERQDALPVVANARLPRASRRTLALEPLGQTRLAPRTRVRVRVCPVGGASSRDRTLTLRSRALPVTPVARASHVVARRSGGRVVVTWTTARPAVRTSYVAVPQRTRAAATALRMEFASVRGRGRTRFRVVLHAPASARWVRVLSTSLEPGAGSGDVRVRIRAHRA